MAHLFPLRVAHSKPLWVVQLNRCHHLIRCRCHLILFYIKPQLLAGGIGALAGCHLILFYIKPQRVGLLDVDAEVVI